MSILRPIGWTVKAARPPTSLDVTCRRLKSQLPPKRIDLSGIFVPMTTPFDAAEQEIAYDRLEKNVRRLQRTPFAGYVVQGSVGEYPMLRWAERVQMVRAVRQFIGPGKTLIAGSGCESTRETIELTKTMAENGADVAMVVNPSFYKGVINDRVLAEHYTAVADSSPIPVMLYSVPYYTGMDLSPELVIDLSVHPNIIGLKDSGGDVAKLAMLVRRTQTNHFQILTGSASILLPSLLSGCVGGVCGLANVLGEDICRLYRLYHQANQADKDLQQRLVEPNLAVTKRFGIPGLKAAMDLFGAYGGPCRRPLSSLDADQRRTVARMFLHNGFQPKSQQ